MGQGEHFHSIPVTSCPPRTPLGELTAIPRPIASGRRLAAPPQEPYPALCPSSLEPRPFGPRASIHAPPLGEILHTPLSYYGLLLRGD